MHTLFHAHIYGRKRWLLVPPEDHPYVYNHRDVFCAVNASHPDPLRHPLFAKARVLEVECGPGEILFVPYGWWHHVVSLEPAISVCMTNWRPGFQTTEARLKRQCESIHCKRQRSGALDPKFEAQLQRWVRGQLYSAGLNEAPRASPAGVAREMLKQALLGRVIMERVKRRALLPGPYLEWLEECHRRGLDDATALLLHLMDGDESTALGRIAAVVR